MAELTPLPIAQTAVQDFFSRMFENILAGRVTLESVLLVVGFFGTFVLLTTLSYVVPRRPKETLLDHPLSWILEKPRIMELLDAAVSQRSKVRVSFHRDFGSARSTDAVLVDAREDWMKLELSSVKNISPEWRGRTLDLVFRVSLPEQPKLQATFLCMASIIDYAFVDQGIVQLRVSRPTRLEQNQNRQHLRVEPPEKYVQDVCLWTEEQVRHQADPKDPETWGQPLFSVGPDGTPEVELENLSGGGIRVKIVPGALRAKGRRYTVGEVFFVRLVLLDSDMSGFVTHYLAARLLKCYDDCDSRLQLSLGLSFAAVGVVQQPPQTGLGWRAVDRDNGVRELDNWAYELHLELYRNKGIA